jgi:hypothetical protein
MGAPLGFKTFATGDVLTAADTNGYLMQGVWTFASAAARDAAVTSPQEGNVCYLKDTDAIMTYSGSAWVAVGGSGGMTQISSTAMSTGTVSLTSIPATYKNLRLVLRDLYPSAATYFGLQVNTDTGANYTFYGQNFGGVNVPDPVRQVNGTIVYLNYTNAKATDNNNTIIIDFNDYANTSTVKQIISNSNVYGDTVNAWTGATLNTSYTSTSAISSIQIKTGAGTFSGGTAILYGVN